MKDIMVEDDPTVKLALVFEDDIRITLGEDTNVAFSIKKII